MNKREELEKEIEAGEAFVASRQISCDQLIKTIEQDEQQLAELRRQLAELDEPTEWVADVNKPFEFIDSANGVQIVDGVYGRYNELLIDSGNAYEPGTGKAQAVADARQATVNIRRAVGKVATSGGKPNGYAVLMDGKWHNLFTSAVVPNAIYIGGLNFEQILIDHAEDFAKIKNCIDKGLNII